MRRPDFLKALLGSLALPWIAKGNAETKAVAPTPKKPRYLYSGTVAGTDYYEYGKFGYGMMPEGNEHYSRKHQYPEHEAKLVLEPNNHFDYKAIEVYWNNQKMGYIPRRHNKILYNLLKDGAQLTAKIRLQYHYDDDILPNIHSWTAMFDLRIRVYLEEG